MVILGLLYLQLPLISLFYGIFTRFAFTDPQWNLVFKAVSDIDSEPNVTDGIDINDPFKVWERDEPFNENTHAAQLTTDFRGHYKSHLALDWETQNIDKVLL